MTHDKLWYSRFLLVWVFILRKVDSSESPHFLQNSRLFSTQDKLVFEVYFTLEIGHGEGIQIISERQILPIEAVYIGVPTNSRYSKHLALL